MTAVQTEAKPTPGSHIADPGPLGLAAFALTTFILSVVNSGIVPQALVGGALGAALAYGGIGQLIAGLWEFAKGNTFGATAFVSYGGFWISFWWLAEHDLGGLVQGSPNDAHKVVGVYLLAWTIFTAYMLVALLGMGNVKLIAVFAVLTLTFLVLAIGWFHSQTGTGNIIKVGGYLGIVTALLAWFTSATGVIASTKN